MAKKLGAFLYDTGSGKVAINDLDGWDPAQLGQNPAFLWVEDSSSFPDDNGTALYQEICSIANPNLENGLLGENSTTDYKQNRDYLKQIIEAVGWDNLSAASQKAAAKQNIGTGAQIIAAIPDDNERDQSSYEYLKKVKGYPIGVRPERALWTEALVWSRTKHINITIPVVNKTVSAPVFILDLTTIDDAGQGEMDGILLELYTVMGIQGIALGDDVVGLGDAMQETAGTRYAPYDPVLNPTGGGLRTHPLLSGIVPSGFADMDAFVDRLYNVWQNGEY